MSKPEDLIPELQGRFPLKVKLESLREEDFYRILKEPDNSLLRQYKELLRVEGITLDFTEDAIKEIAHLAFMLNEENENIGARRLHSMMEILLGDVMFEGSDLDVDVVTIDEGYVKEKLGSMVGAKDLSAFIL